MGGPRLPANYPITRRLWVSLLHHWVILVMLGLTCMQTTSVAEEFDLSRHSVPPDEIFSGGPPKDGIPALTDPDVTAAGDTTYLRPQDRILGVELNGEARAYPIRILNWHEVVNDRVGGLPIVVSYCPLCGSGMVFRADAKPSRRIFGVSGLLYKSDVLLYDRKTDSLWSQLRMEAITGPLLGEQLEWLPVVQTTWKAWRREHPTTGVLSLNTGHRRDYGRDPYAGYAKTESTMFPVGHRDSRLHPKAWVLGVIIGSQAKAYPLDRLVNGEVLEDMVGNQSIHILYDASARSAWVTDVSGKSLPSVQSYWFAWAAFYPDTLLHDTPPTNQTESKGERTG